MKNTTMLISMLFILIFAGVFFLKNSATTEINQIKVPTVNTEEVQKIILSIKDYNYYPNTIKVREGIPVSITLDSSISGCFRSFTIRDLGINKYSKNPKDTIDFIPNKKGTFRFACSMGMGTGTIIVE
jgi:plastocyanin domain-containing protein